MLEQIATVEICVGPPVLPNGRYLLGLGFILAQCFVWVATSVLTQYMFQETVVESPFLMTYVGVALCLIMFPVRWVHEKLTERQASDVDTGATLKHDDESFDEDLTQASAYHSIVEVMTMRSIQNAQSKKPWNHKKHALAALQ